MLAIVLAVERRSTRWAALAGALTGVAILGNSRLVLLPLALAAYVVWRLGFRAWVAGVALVAAAAVAVAPWVIRNRVELGCATITTDARALWKANNLQTYHVLASGHWIDDVKDPPGHPFPNPEEARDLYRETGQKRRRRTSALNMRYYQHRVRTFWRNHPGAKAKLMVQAIRMQLGPRTTKTVSRPGKGPDRHRARLGRAALHAGLLFALGLVGLLRVPRGFVVLASCCSPTRRSPRWCSSAPRGIASPGTS